MVGGQAASESRHLDAFGLDPSFFDAEDAIGRAGLAKLRPAVREKERRFYEQLTCESGQSYKFPSGFRTLPSIQTAPPGMPPHSTRWRSKSKCFPSGNRLSRSLAREYS